MSAAARRDRQMFRRLEGGEVVTLAELRGTEEAEILAAALEAFLALPL